MSAAGWVSFQLRNASQADIQAAAVDCEQDWDVGETVYTFADGSRLRQSGPVVTCESPMCTGSNK